MFEYIVFWIYFKVNFDKRSRNFYSLFGLFKLHHMKFGCKQYQEIHLQRAIPVKKSCPPLYHQNISEKAVVSLSPRPLSGAWFLSKRRLHVRIMWKKGKGRKCNSFLSAKYSYAYAHSASLSENRSVAPQNHQNISEAKCEILNIPAPLANNFVFCSFFKKCHPQFRESENRNPESPVS